MGRRAILLASMLLALSACSTKSEPSEPASSIPPDPVPPDGWSMAIAFGGTGGTGMTGASLTLSDAPVAVHAACAGSGTLVVLLSAASSDESAPSAGTSAVFQCGEGGATTDERVDLPNAPSGDVTALAFVVEGAGVNSHAAFNISLEQHLQAASVDR